MKNKFKLLGASAAITLASATFAADLYSPFEALPAETIGAFRFDNSTETLDRYVESTKIGKLLLSEEKVAKYKAYIEKLVNERDAETNLLQKLADVGLELDDLYAMLTSEIGGAVVMQPVQDHQPMPTVLLWAEMEEGVAEQAFSAILSGAAENEAIERTDLELPGAAGSRIRNRADGTSFLIANLENRFVFGIGQVTEPITTPEQAELFENAELEALGVFLAAQLEGGGEFLSTFYSDAAINTVRPNFETRLEVIGDVAQLLQFVPPQSAQIVDGLELSSFSKFGIWSGLVDMEERSTFFLGAPTPRSGLASLMDTDAFEFQAPAWVPASVNTYSTISFDLGKVYDLIVATAKKFLPPEMVEQQIAMANQQLGMMLQTDLDTLISSFGKRAHVVEYPMEVIDVDMPGGGSMEVPRAPQVMVMDFSRPEILQAGFAMMGGMAAADPNSGVEMVNEQGFSGIRAANGAQGVVTMAHGKGKLVISVGSDSTASRIFSALNTVPEGEDALINDEALRAFLAEQAPKPGIAFSVTRGDKVLKNIVPALETVLKTIERGGNAEQAAQFEELINLFPSEEELEGLLGFGFTRMYANEGGLVLEGVSEYK